MEAETPRPDDPKRGAVYPLLPISGLTHYEHKVFLLYFVAFLKLHFSHFAI